MLPPMTRPTSLAVLAALAAIGLAACDPALETTTAQPPNIPATRQPSYPAIPPHPHSSLLYGRVTADGGTWEGRLRWGKGDQEASWSDLFDGWKDDNLWAKYAPGGEPERRLEVFGFEFGPDPSPFARMFAAHFGDIARVQTSFSQVEVVLKSGTSVILDRFAASDIDDGVRVWDKGGQVVDLDTKQIHAIEFLPTPPLSNAPDRLHGVVQTRAGSFSGFIQWNQRHSLATDILNGRAADGATNNLPFSTIQSIARDGRDATLVTLTDGRIVTLSGTRDAGRENRGVYVDDARFGRVLVRWDQFERVDFGAGGSGRAYTDFQPGRTLTGRVTTRDGRHLSGRIVYDLDESEGTDTLDVTRDGIEYSVPFARVAAIKPRAAGGGTVTLRDGTELQVERAGDLDVKNAGVLIFAAGDTPAHAGWREIERIDFGIADR